jgi:LysR family transcriptional regulator, transcriptional activator of nhaA
MMYNYNHLYYFYIAAKLEGITKAAEHLNTSQPSLSYQIKTLEEQLKKKLFLKKGRNLCLTDEGQIVYNYCKRMFEVSEEMEEYLKGESRLRHGYLRIGISPDIERPFIADIISSTIKSLGRVDLPVISMISENNSDMANSLRLQKIDLLITHTPTYDENFELLTTVNLPVGLVASPRLAESLGLRENASILEILRKSSKKLILPSAKIKLRSEIDLFMQKKKVNMHMIFESDMLASMARVVFDGVGVAFLPIPYIQNELKKNTIKLYPSTKVGLWQHKLTMIVRKNKKHSFFIERLMQLIQDA